MADFITAYRTTSGLSGGYFPSLGTMLGAAFSPSYMIVRKNEGGYVNDPNDLGGETYRGIARKIHPTWYGWPLIDAYKRKYGTPKTASFIADQDIEDAVDEFYYAMWTAKGFGNIQSQDVANIFFDFYILAAKATLTMQQTVNSLGGNVSEDNLLGPATIAAINSVDPARLYNAYKQARIRYHEDRVNSGAVSASFLPGWLARTMQFPDLTVAQAASAGIGFLLLIAAGAALTYEPSRKWIMKQLDSVLS